ncbi:MAG: PQQ-binding-like beta-propeller repeat protein [Planctomycetia bacterium]
MRAAISSLAICAAATTSAALATPATPAGPWRQPPAVAFFAEPDPWKFPTVEEFKGWVEPAGEKAVISTGVFKHVNPQGEGYLDLTLAKSDGLVRLKRPLEPGKALRLRLAELPPAIIAWSGSSGAVLAADFNDPLFGRRFPGPTAVRRAAEPRPAARALVASSAARVFGAGFFGQVVPGLFQPLLDLAHHDGRLILSSGDITLVEVPLAEPPDEIFFDGPMLCGSIEMVSFVPPPRPASRLAATERWKPADLDWQVVGGGANGKADPARLERAADGSVRLAQPADKPAAAIAALWKIPPGPRGPREIIVHLEKCSSGAGLCYAGPDGKPWIVAGLVKPKGLPDAAGLLVDLWPAAENRLEGGDPKRAGAAWVQGDAVWFRLRFGPRPCVVLSVSGDGVHWAELGKQVHGPPPVAVGVFAPPVAGAGVTLQGLAAADYPGLAALVPEDLVAAADKATPDAAVADPAAWEEKVRAAKPEAVAADHWAAIVATRSLTRQAHAPTLDVALLGHLHGYALRDELPLEARIAICDDITRLWCDTGGWNSVNILGIYALVGERLLAADDFAGLERLRRAVIDSPACVGGGAWFDPLHQQVRWLERLAIAGPVEEYARVAMRASFGFTEVFGNYRSRMPLASWCLHDIATRLGAAPLVKGGRPPDISYWVGGLSSWDPPLTIGYRTEIGIEAANGLADLVQQVDQQDWPAAQQALARLGEALADDPDVGVAGMPGDPERSVSPRLLVAALLDAQPEFREHMRAIEEPKAALRLQMLRTAGDARGMAAAALAFAGTPSAAAACGWLGDREIAAGRFARGREWYRWGLRCGAGEQAARLEAGARFAAVLNGGPVAGGAAPVGPVAGPEAEAVEKDLLAARGNAAAGDPWRPVDAPAAALPPRAAAFKAVPRLEVAGGPFAPATAAGISDPRDNRIQHSLLDFAARAWTFTPAGPLLVAVNRAEVVAIDAAQGTQVWRTGVDAESRTVRPVTDDARPALDARHVYVRRTLKAGRQLAALRLADGGVGWETAAIATFLIASSPVLIDGELRVLAIRTGGLSNMLVMAGFDRATGRQTLEQPLMPVADSWFAKDWPSLRDHNPNPGDAELTAVGDRLYATAGGAVFCCDAAGGLVWFRQQPWVPWSADLGLTLAPTRLPPILDDGRLLVAQVGVPALTALDPADGRLLWRKPWTGLLAVAGLTGAGADRRLVVEAADGLHAVNPRNGAARLLVPRVPRGDWLGLGGIGQLYGPPLLCADGMAVVPLRRQAAQAGKPVWEPRLAWIDVATGAVRHEADVTDVAGGANFVGPLTAASGKFFALVQKEPPGERGHGAVTTRTVWEFAPQP